MLLNLITHTYSQKINLVTWKTAGNSDKHRYITILIYCLHQATLCQLVSYLLSWTCPEGSVWLLSANWSSRPPHQGPSSTAGYVGTPGCVLVWVPKHIGTRSDHHRPGTAVAWDLNQAGAKNQVRILLYHSQGGSPQLVFQPRLLGLLEQRAGGRVIKQLRIKNQAQDSTHLRQQERQKRRFISLDFHDAFFIKFFTMLSY